MQLPDAVLKVAELFASQPSVSAVVLGGSRALGTGDDSSDWDLGVYYRDQVDLDCVAAYGTLFPPGAWGRLMNGGAWLNIDGLKIDVMLRDTGVVRHWTDRTIVGEFERDALLGYLAGAPTYLLVAELASCRPIAGTITPVAYPHALSASAPSVWRFCRDFSITYAYALQKRSDVIGAKGQMATAAMCEAHARLCEWQLWVCNEKRMISSAGMDSVQSLFYTLPDSTGGLADWISTVAQALKE